VDEKKAGDAATSPAINYPAVSIKLLLEKKPGLLLINSY
jgi:hypothetical protein